MSDQINLRLTGKVNGAENPCTYFADYCEQDISINQLYLVKAINGREISINAIGYQLTIKQVRDQFGSELELLPKGNKAIVVIDWIYSPFEVDKLRQAGSWDETPGSVALILRRSG